METYGKASSASVRRMFEEYCASGLTPQETLLVLRNDGFSSSDLAGLVPAKAGRKFSRRAAGERGAADSRELGAGDRVGDRANEGRPARNIPAALRGFSDVWKSADLYPWRTLALIAIAAASLAALTAWKVSRSIWNLATKRSRR